MNRGALAEETAARYLQQCGLRLLHRNYRSRFGEIDLILDDGGTLVFAEVRLRGRADFGGAAASIDARKQQRLVLTARHFLATLSQQPPCRFDAVLLTAAEDGEIIWLKDAFRV